MSDPSAAIGPVILSVVLGLAVYAWTAASLQAVFRKAGEDGWKAWVPFLNTFTLLRLGRMSGWWVLLVIVPPLAIVLWIIQIVACHRINVSFGRGAGSTVLAALLLPVWSSILGWGSAHWVGDDDAPGPRRSSPELAARFGGPATERRVETSPFAPGAAPASFSPSGARPAAPPIPDPPVVPVASVPSSASSVDAQAPIPSVSPVPAPAVEPAPASATLPVVSAARGFDAFAADDAVPPPPPPATASAASTRSPVRGFPGPVASAGDAAPPADPDRPGPLRSRGGPAAGYDDDDDADVVDDPLEQPRPRVGSLVPESSTDTPPGPRRGRTPADAEADDDSAARPADPWAPPATPYGTTRAPRFSPEPSVSGASFSDTSAEVSAVIGAPRLGEPMAARASVSARRAASELPSEDQVFDQTMVAARRRTTWTLVPPLGAPVPISRDVLIIGRRPGVDPAHPGAQLVSVADETRTMSKTHARLELHEGEWTIVDLDSTNGVVLLSPDGRETELLPRRPHVATSRFLLGDAELRLERDDA